jgi:hypothetical protein
MCELLVGSASAPVDVKFFPDDACAKTDDHRDGWGVPLANTQPFVREIRGRVHVFRDGGGGRDREARVAAYTAAFVRDTSSGAACRYFWISVSIFA